MSGQPNGRAVTGDAMRRGAVLIASLSCAWGLATGTVRANEATPLADDPVVEQRLLRISEEIRCLVCQNESLAGSRADLANDLRREIRKLIREGKTDAEVTDFLVSRYGDFVLYRPPVKPLTWLLWFGPFAVMVAAVIGLLRLLNRRERAHAGSSTAPLTDAERRRAEALLAPPEP